jgi:hypothetical protein
MPGGPEASEPGSSKRLSPRRIKKSLEKTQPVCKSDEIKWVIGLRFRAIRLNKYLTCRIDDDVLRVKWNTCRAVGEPGCP